jgi:transposase-like protein
MARKTPRVRRTFTPQFKKDAVAVVEAGRSVNAVAHDLGIARSLLQRNILKKALAYFADDQK